jgi:low temperature requirement protein LtrA
MTDAQERGAQAPKAVSTAELFFDLVFVFAFIQVTALVLEHSDIAGLGRGLVVLALLWWAWAGFAWLTNAVDTGSHASRLVLLGSMAAMLVVAVAVPTAFTDNAVVFAAAYVVVRALHLVLYAVTSGWAILRLAPGFATACGLLMVGAFLTGWAQAGLWLAAIAVDYGFPLLRGTRGLNVHAAHWAERFNLIVILALGETVIASGLGVVAAGGPLTLPVITGIVVVIAVIGGFWWSYFGAETHRTEQRLLSSTGLIRTHLARDAYAYLHLVLVGGIVVTAAGLETAMHHPLDRLEGIYPASLGGGAALFFLGLACIAWRRGDRIRPELPTAALAALGLVALAYVVPALVALVVLAAVLAAVTTIDTRRAHEAPAPETS